MLGRDKEFFVQLLPMGYICYHENDVVVVFDVHPGFCLGKISKPPSSDLESEQLDNVVIENAPCLQLIACVLLDVLHCLIQ